MSHTTKLRRQQARLGKHMTDLMLAAPQVVMSRVMGMATAGGAPSSRQLAEMQRMGDEKVEAFVESWTAMSMQAMTWPWQMASVGWKLATGAMLRPQTPMSVLGDSAQWSTQMQSSALDVALKGLAPVRRRAMANARRLQTR